VNGKRKRNKEMRGAYDDQGRRNGQMRKEYINGDVMIE
jgi:hypothetical protein